MLLNIPINYYVLKELIYVKTSTKKIKLIQNKMPDMTALRTLFT